MSSIEEIEKFLGVQFERVEGELLPPVFATKNRASCGKFEIEWITPRHSEVEPDARFDRRSGGESVEDDPPQH